MQEMEEFSEGGKLIPVLLNVLMCFTALKLAQARAHEVYQITGKNIKECCNRRGR